MSCLRISVQSEHKTEIAKIQTGCAGSRLQDNLPECERPTPIWSSLLQSLHGLTLQKGCMRRPRLDILMVTSHQDF